MDSVDSDSNYDDSISIMSLKRKYRYFDESLCTGFSGRRILTTSCGMNLHTNSQTSTVEVWE